MAWELLRTDYKDAVWTGLRKFVPIDNGDGSYSAKDVTQYTVYEESFFGAYDANRINTAVNAIMASLENGTDLYEVFTEFFENQKTEFKEEAGRKNTDFESYLNELKAMAGADIEQMKSEYTSEINSFENAQETAFTTWFNLIRNQLGLDAAGNLQLQIGNLADLTTDNKDSLVLAINEVYHNSDMKIGELSELDTDEKENLVSAINEVTKLVGQANAVLDKL